jgi:uncharacterized protein YggU (UPF0235/DUF167 family)
MKIAVKVKTRAKEEKVERVSQPELNLGERKLTLDIYKVSVKEAPVAGRANIAVIKALADYFSVAPSCIQLLTGQTAKQKIFEISCFYIGSL